MKGHLDAAVQRLRAPGVLGLGVLVACATFWVEGLQPVREQIGAQRLALERMRLRSANPAFSAGARAEDLRRFHELFPPASALSGELERLHRAARAARLELSQGEYRLERHPGGLWAYRVSLPVRGGYPEVRNFVSAVLKEMPTASIDGLRFERKQAGDPQLEAQLRLTLYLRP